METLDADTCLEQMAKLEQEGVKFMDEIQNLIGMPSVVIIGVLVALKGRMHEIEGGEEDEASKYQTNGR